MIAILLPLLVSCGSAGPTTEEPTFPDTPFLSATGSAFTVTLKSSPQPPVRGQSVFRLTVSDSKGAGVPGLQVAVQPWMPLMGHGTSATPVVSEIGAGVYEVRNVYLFMAGLWELRIDLKGEATDHVAPQFEIH